MTDSQASETVVITNRMRDIIAHMLTAPRERYYASAVAVAIGGKSGTVSPLMARMADAGWIKGETEARTGPHAPRRYYRFTTGSATMLRRAIR